ncbi:MAG: acetylxylan esterase [Methylacidiphilales bacterium]|nr:acetylxylan esterase [Candidatus Methylacidiphilales bacterium]
MKPISIHAFPLHRAFRCLAAVIVLGAAFQIDGRADTNTNSITNAVKPPDPWNAIILTVTPDHANGVYALNEPVVWTADVKTGDRSGLAAVPYVVKRDGGDTIAQGTIDLSTGPATITATRAEPGALLAVISVPTATKHPRPFTGGAIFAPDKIGPGAPAPADFDAFWKAQLAYLDSIPQNPVVEQGSLADIKYNDGIPYYKVTLDNIWNTKVQGQLSRPVKGDKFPGLLIFQAAGVSALEKGMVLGAAKHGYLVLNIEAHDIPIDQPPAFYTSLKGGGLKDYISFGIDSRDTYYFLRMVLGCVRAAEYLTSRADWDGKTLIVSGVSQGGFQSFATAALFPQVTALCTSAPAADDSAATLATPPRPPSWPASYLPPRPDDPDGSKARATLSYFDTTYFAARIHCPAQVCVGLIDETVRPASVLATYNAIPGTAKELMIFPFYDHSLACGQVPFWHRKDEWLAAAAAGQPLPPVPTDPPTPNAITISGSGFGSSPTPTAAPVPAATPTPATVPTPAPQ